LARSAVSVLDFCFDVEASGEETMADEVVNGPPAPAGLSISINLFAGTLAGKSVEYQGGPANEDVAAGEKNDVVRGGDGTDTLNGNEGADELYGGADGDLLRGMVDNDTLNGDGGNDSINGNAGLDVARGGDGADSVYGGQGGDTLFGDSGNDLISGDLGNDILWGGDGADRFTARAGGGIDWIADFSYAQGDRIQLAPGALYTIASVSGQVFLDLGGGHGIGLVGVSIASLGSDFVVAG
jgi:Ca2+-binding RTX toxin-like protein